MCPQDWAYSGNLMGKQPTLAEALKAERTARSQNARQAGVELGVSHVTISNWQRGALPVHTEHWLALMAYLHITKEAFAEMIAETVRREHLARFVIEGI